MFARFHKVERFDRFKDEPRKQQNWCDIIMQALDIPVCDECGSPPNECLCVKTPTHERVWDGPFFD